MRPMFFPTATTYRKETGKMNKTLRIAMLAICALSVTAIAHAQSGCGDSPENPTVVLALVGAAGVSFNALRNKFRRK